MILDAPLNYRSPKWGKISLKAKQLVTSMLVKDIKARATLDEVLENEWLKLAEKDI